MQDHWLVRTFFGFNGGVRLIRVLLYYSGTYYNGNYSGHLYIVLILTSPLGGR